MSKIKLIFRFTKALIQWVCSGFKLRSPMTTAYIYKYKCQPCEKFVPSDNPSVGHCSVCGCFLRKEGIVLNKIAWKTEKCPEGHWK